MDIRKLQRAIVDGLEDVKAQNIVVLNTEALSPLFERVIIASGTSNRQTRALASSVRETVKKRGLAVMATEGEDNGEWIIVDCGAAVAHIMQPAIREYYHLEEIWGGKPVRLKTGATRGLPKAEEAAPARGAAVRAAEAPAAGKAATRTPGRPAAPAPTAPTAHPSTTRKATADKTTAGKKAARRTPPGPSQAAAKKPTPSSRPRTPARGAKAGHAAAVAPRASAKRTAPRPPAKKAAATTRKPPRR